MNQDVMQWRKIVAIPNRHRYNSAITESKVPPASINTDRLMLLRQCEFQTCDGISYLVSLNEALPRVTHIDACFQALIGIAVHKRIIHAAEGLAELILPGDGTQSIVAPAGGSVFRLVRENFRTDACSPQSRPVSQIAVVDEARSYVLANSSE
jgi:hypothetical protein